MTQGEDRMEWESPADHARRLAGRAWRGRLAAWARDNGFLGYRGRGRIPAGLQARYIEATGDDIGAILAGIPDPDVVETPYDWLREGEWNGFLQAFNLTLVRQVGPHEALARLPRVRNITGESVTKERARAAGIGFGGAPIGAAHLGGWSVIYELNGDEARTSIERLAEGTEAVSVWVNFNGIGRFCYCVDGEIVVEFDQRWPSERRGSDPDRLVGAMEEIGLDPIRRYSIKDADLKALTLADHVTGVHIGPESLRGPFVWGEIRNVPPSRT